MHKNEIDLRDQAVWMLYLSQAWILDGWTNPMPPKNSIIGPHSKALDEQLNRQIIESKETED